MVMGEATGREGWLRLLCLTVSLGVHAALVAVSWQQLRTTPADLRPLTVLLVERPQVSSPEAPPLPNAAGPPRAPQVTISPAPASSPEAVTVSEPAETAIGTGTDTGGEVSLSPAGGRAGSAAAPTVTQPQQPPLIKATPRYETNPLPSYPRLARQNHWEGTVRLRVRVTSGGVVEAVTLERSSGYEVLDRAALNGVRQWRFIPATRNGVPVPSEMSLPIAFRLKE